MTQEEIKYQNTLSRHQCGWLREAPFKSLGNVIHWVYTYSTLSVAERITVGEGKVLLFGELLATFTFDESLMMPIFDFSDKYDWIGEKQRIFLRYMDRNSNVN